MRSSISSGFGSLLAVLLLEKCNFRPGPARAPHQNTEWFRLARERALVMIYLNVSPPLSF
jgi:hypothetical protein